MRYARRAVKRVFVAVATVIFLALCGLASSTSAQTVIVPGPPITIAQRIFQGIEHFAPHDRFWLDPQGGDTEAETSNDFQSSVSFSCETCGSYDVDGWFLDYFSSHNDAVSYAILTIQLEGPPDVSPYFPVYVAGDAVMTGPAPARVIRAFSLAVRKPVVTYRHG
jgi:hypothetical protein